MLSDADVEYIRSGFIDLEELCRDTSRDPAAVRAQIEGGVLPRASYVLDDGAEMVPFDYFALADDAGGADLLRERFIERYERAASAEHDVSARAEEEWEAYLSGEYGVCLKHVTPETIVRKAGLISQIEELLAEAKPDDSDWAGGLRAAVEELDELEREFAALDRVRFGGPSSRDRLITGTREAYPEIFERTAVDA